MACGALIILAGFAAPLAITAGAPAAVAPQLPGTDISNKTTVTSWQDVAAAGMTFVGIEAAQGKTISNENYGSEVTAAAQANLFVMPYVYADPGKIANGATQFTTYAWPVIDGVSGAPYARGGLMLPVALDMESDPINFPTEPCYGLSPTAMVTWIGQFITAAHNTTLAWPVIYTNPNWWASCTGNTTAFRADPLWIADYGVSRPAIPPGWSGYTFWQSSNVGTITGIAGAGDADLDQMQGAPATMVAKSGTSGSLQVQTLNALAGQAVTYSASGLKPGLSLSSGGTFSWTSATAVGSYPVTVTPSGPALSPSALPSAVSFTLNVHGAITVVSPGTRTTVAGTPISFGVATTGPDGGAGFPPSLRASGLPTGVSMSSTGAISGWPSRPGTYKVTLSASDALGGTGSAAFTWTVKTAADTGSAGAIRQVGGTGKCLNDPRSSTANGTSVSLWSCDGKANQKWTVVQDGTIRVLGKCLAASGTSLVLWGCSAGSGNQEWRAGTDGELISAQSGKCLYFPGANAANGSKPTMASCANVTTQSGQHWNRPAASVASGEPGKCLAGAGSAAELVTCANTARQHWTAGADGTLRLGSSCLTRTGSAVGSTLSVGPCSGAAATKWTLVPDGPIATELAGAAGLCVTSPSATAGARLILGSCAATPAATWRVG